MAINDKMDRMKAIIERELRNETKKDNNQLINYAFNSVNEPHNEREQRAIFEFITGKTPKEYIDEKRILIVCEELRKIGKWPLNHKEWNRLYSIAGVQTQKAFIAKFGRKMGMTPGEFYKSDCSFGGDIPKVEIPARRLMTLQKHYDLNSVESDIALKITEEYGYSIDDVFLYVYLYSWYFIYVSEMDAAEFYFEINDYDYVMDSKEVEIRDVRNCELMKLDFLKKRDLFIEEELLDKTVLYLYFEVGLGFDEIRRIRYAEAAEMLEENIHKYSKSKLQKIAFEVGIELGEEFYPDQYNNQDYYDSELYALDPYEPDPNEYECDDEEMFYMGDDEDDYERLQEQTFESEITDDEIEYWNEMNGDENRYFSDDFELESFDLDKYIVESQKIKCSVEEFDRANKKGRGNIKVDYQKAVMMREERKVRILMDYVEKCGVPSEMIDQMTTIVKLSPSLMDDIILIAEDVLEAQKLKYKKIMDSIKDLTPGSKVAHRDGNNGIVKEINEQEQYIIMDNGVTQIKYSYPDSFLKGYLRYIK